MKKSIKKSQKGKDGRTVSPDGLGRKNFRSGDPRTSVRPPKAEPPPKAEGNTVSPNGLACTFGSGLLRIQSSIKLL